MQERALAIGSELVCVQREVPPSTSEQLAMRSLLGNPALLDDDDQICPTNRRKSVCNDEGNAPTTIAAVQNFVDAFLDETLSRRVDRTRRFVHHENFRVAQHCPRERDKLALACRKSFAALTDLRVVRLLKALDERVCAHAPRSGFDFRIRRFEAAVPNVLAHRSCKEMRNLRHDANALNEPIERQIAVIDAIDRDATCAWFIETGRERHDRRLAATRGADKRDRLPTPCSERKIMQHRHAFAIPKVDRFKSQLRDSPVCSS